MANGIVQCVGGHYIGRASIQSGISLTGAKASKFTGLTFTQPKQRYLPHDIVRLTEMQYEQAKSFAGTAAAAGAGVLLFGGIGLLAGALAGGKKQLVIVVLDFFDGKQVAFATPANDYAYLCLKLYAIENDLVAPLLLAQSEPPPLQKKPTAKTCKKCGLQVSARATRCPHCRPEKKRTGCLAKLGVGILLFTAASIMLSHCDPPAPKAPATTPAPPQTPSSAQAQQPQPAPTPAPDNTETLRSLGLAWNYSEEKDEMGNGSVHQAHVNSNNIFEFGFPYQRPQRATLQLRKHPRFGRDVILSVERGQFMCGVSSCSVQVRFDDGNVQTYSATGPADHDSTVLFIRGYERFVAAARKSKTVAIEAQFYREGNRVLQFNTAGLDF